MNIPYIAGKWRILFKPEKNGNYVNDHSIVVGSDGRWHLYGITSFEGKPAHERYFVHGVGESLDKPFTEVGRSIDRGTLAWAPCVVEKDEKQEYGYGNHNAENDVSVRKSEDCTEHVAVEILIHAFCETGGRNTYGKCSRRNEGYCRITLDFAAFAEAEKQKCRNYYNGNCNCERGKIQSRSYYHGTKTDVRKSVAYHGVSFKYKADTEKGSTKRNEDSADYCSLHKRLRIHEKKCIKHHVHLP